MYTIDNVKVTKYRHKGYFTYELYMITLRHQQVKNVRH
jgi:hypothetical protein